MGTIDHDLINFHFSFPFYLTPNYDIKHPFDTSSDTAHFDLNRFIVKYELAV